MIPYSSYYIIPGDVFADETVLCIRCGVAIMGLSYREMPSVNDPKKMVNVAYQKKYWNYELVPVVLYRHGFQSITALPTCKECVKEIDPKRDSSDIIKQIKYAMQIEAKHVGMSEETIRSIDKEWLDAYIPRKLNPQEIAQGRILEESVS